jgi:hypothetical protein
LRVADPEQVCVPPHEQLHVYGAADTLATYCTGDPNPDGQPPEEIATGTHPAGVVAHELGAGVHGPHAPAASHVCVAPALQVAALPHDCVACGTQLPVHFALEQTNAHGAPDCHCPFASHVWGVCPEHWVDPGVQANVGASIGAASEPSGALTEPSPPVVDASVSVEASGVGVDPSGDEPMSAELAPEQPSRRNASAVAKERRTIGSYNGSA